MNSTPIIQSESDPYQLATARGTIRGAVIAAFLWLLLGGMIAGLFGCAGPNATFDQRQQRIGTALDALRQANFDGEFDFQEGGSMLGVNACTNWSLGPAQSNLHVRGTVDFTKPPRQPEVLGPTTTKTTTATP